MTKVVFKQLAGELKIIRPPIGESTNTRLMWIQSCEAVARVCKRFNDKFNEEKFIEACGVSDPT